MSDVIDGLNAQLAATAALPEDAAASMPGAFYASPDYFTHEVETVLKKAWHCLGRVDEVPAPGDYVTSDLLGEPLLIVRGNDNLIRVLSNVCRHRGMPLAEGSGSTRRFVCSYHAWSYERDGTLGNAPRINRDRISPQSCRLPSFKSEIWNGFIYDNLHDTAAPLTPTLTGLDRSLSNYGPDDYRIVHVAVEEWRTNWKCLVENFMEAYHLSVVHPETLHPYTPTGLSHKSMSDGAFTSYCANYPDGIASRGKGPPALTDEERKRSTLFCLYPTQVASQSATLLVSYSLQPVSVDRVRVRWTMSTYGTELTQVEIEQRVALWAEVNREDRVKLERLQTVLGSRHASSGPLAPSDYEGTISDFYRYLDQQQSRR